MNDVKDEHEVMEVIHRYTRRQAIEDGFLVDVTASAQKAGLMYPVTLTRGVYDNYAVVPPGVEGQDVEGRLWDILWCLRVAIGNEQPDGAVLQYSVAVRNDNRQAQDVQLKAVSGPDDDGQPCLTVMHPWED